MTSKHKPILTNVDIYKSIADAAYYNMSEDMGKNVKPRPEDSSGAIKTFDPEQTSFEQAMISTVFTCIWLEAILHLLIVDKFGKKCYTEVDHKIFEEKLKLLGCKDTELLENVERLRKVRNELVHEKAYFEFNDVGKFTGVFRTGQDEAEIARAVMTGVAKWLPHRD